MAPVGTRSLASTESSQLANQLAVSAPTTGFTQNTANTGPTQNIADAVTAPPIPKHTNPSTQPGATPSFSGPALGLTREQLDARFALEQRKFEADLRAVEAQTDRENEESRARIAALQAGSVAAAVPRAQADKEEPVGEIPPAALLVASRYPGLPKAEIARIFSNKF